MEKKIQNQSFLAKKSFKDINTCQEVFRGFRVKEVRLIERYF